MNELMKLEKVQQLWDDAAEAFDEEPDHGLRDPVVRAAWRELLVALLPTAPMKVLDIGCGTGSLSVLMAEMGHAVVGADLSEQMVLRARAKAATAEYNIQFQVMNAAKPEFDPAQFDVIVCRHVLWALPEPAAVLERWARLLKRDGRLILIEGFWQVGDEAGGLHAQQVRHMLPSSLVLAVEKNLSDQPALWGRPVADERYVIVADLSER